MITQGRDGREKRKETDNPRGDLFLFTHLLVEVSVLFIYLVPFSLDQFSLNLVG